MAGTPIYHHAIRIPYHGTSGSLTNRVRIRADPDNFTDSDVVPAFLAHFIVQPELRDCQGTPPG